MMKDKLKEREGRDTEIVWDKGKICGTLYQVSMDEWEVTIMGAWVRFKTEDVTSEDGGTFTLGEQND